MCSDLLKTPLSSALCRDGWTAPETTLHEPPCPRGFCWDYWSQRDLSKHQISKIPESRQKKLSHKRLQEGTKDSEQDGYFQLKDYGFCQFARLLLSVSALNLILSKSNAVLEEFCSTTNLIGLSWRTLFNCFHMTIERVQREGTHTHENTKSVLESILS